MQNFRVDFAMNREHEMILDREADLSRAELDELELRMLQAGPIAGLLPIEWMDMNGSITFRYRITGQRMLKHRLQSASFEMKHYFSLLLGIVEALDECKHYMLRAENAILLEPYIFVGERWDEVSLVYVPLIEPVQAVSSLRSSLLSLAVRWSVYVQDQHGGDIQRVLQEIENANGSWQELRASLLQSASASYYPGTETKINIEENMSLSKMRNKRVSDNGLQNHAYNAQNHNNSVQNNSVQNNNKVAEVSAAGGALSNASESDRSLRVLPEWIGVHSELQEEVEEGHTANPRVKWLTSLAILVVAALLWKYLYLGNPTTGMLMVCFGLTLIAVAIIVFMWRKKGHNQEEEYFESDYSEEMEEPIRPESRGIEPIDRASSTSSSFNTQQKRQSMIVDSRELVPISKSKGEDSTMWLGKEEDGTEVDHAGGHCYLVREGEGQKQRLPIQGVRFQIGRAQEAVEYCDTSPGISRIHIEIEAGSGGHYAKDLGSRNGTVLNGTAMVPYKPYKLQNGDVLQLAGAKGPFYEFVSK